MNKRFFFALFVLLFFLTSCDDFLTGAVVSQKARPEHIWCTDGIALNVRDYCINKDSKVFKMLIANAGYGSIDSMDVTFYSDNQEFLRKFPRVNLEPSDSRVFPVPMYDLNLVFDMIHIEWFYSSGESIKKCRNDLTIAYAEIRTCDE